LNVGIKCTLQRENMGSDNVFENENPDVGDDENAED